MFAWPSHGNSAERRHDSSRASGAEQGFGNRRDEHHGSGANGEATRPGTTGRAKYHENMTRALTSEVNDVKSVKEKIDDMEQKNKAAASKPSDNEWQAKFGTKMHKAETRGEVGQQGLMGFEICEGYLQT